MFICSHTVQGMLNLQKLQSLASITQQQKTSMPASLVGLAAGLSTASCLNSPLNLSLTGASSSSRTNDTVNSPVAVAAAAALANNLSGGDSDTALCAPQMPQLILASGQLMQGVQGAQLLIPTSQGKIQRKPNENHMRRK